MKRLFLLSVLLGAGLPLTFAQVAPTDLDEAEIIRREVLRRGDHLQVVEVGGIAAEGPTYEDALAPPADDRQKWFISVISQRGCPACDKLKAAFRGETALAGFADPLNPKRSWAHYREYAIEDEAQAWRWKDVQFRAFPTILIQPPRDGSFGEPAAVVYQGTGFESPAKLAKAMQVAIKKYVAKIKPPRQARYSGGHRAAAADEAGGPQLEAGGPPPFQTEPKTPPAVLPAPGGPTVFPWDDSPQNDPAAAEIPAYPEAVIVYDADDVEPCDFRGLAQRIRANRGGQLKVRLLEFAKASPYSLRRDELPAAVLTSEGRIIEKITRRFLPLIAPGTVPPATPNAALDAESLARLAQQLGPLLPQLLNALNQNQNTPVVAPSNVPAVTVAPSPAVNGPPGQLPAAPGLLESLAALIPAVSSALASGSPLAWIAVAGIAGGIGLRLVRARRAKAGKPLILDDATFAALLDKLALLNTDQLGALLGKILPAFAAKKESIVAAHNSAVSTLQPAPPPVPPPIS